MNNQLRVLFALFLLVSGALFILGYLVGQHSIAGKIGVDDLRSILNRTANPTIIVVGRKIPDTEHIIESSGSNKVFSVWFPKDCDVDAYLERVIP